MANNNHDSAEKVLDFSQGYSTTHLQVWFKPERGFEFLLFKVKGLIPSVY